MNSRAGAKAKPDEQPAGVTEEEQTPNLEICNNAKNNKTSEQLSYKKIVSTYILSFVIYSKKVYNKLINEANSWSLESSSELPDNR